MTPDDIRKLIGGYATGSLTDAERKALLDAALDDQDLFDELGQEQALKELLDEPGAKQRLIAALEPRSKPWLAKAWPWAAGVAALVLAIAALQHPARREVATARIPSIRQEAPSGEIAPAGPDPKVPKAKSAPAERRPTPPPSSSDAAASSVKPEPSIVAEANRLSDAAAPVPPSPVPAAAPAPIVIAGDPATGQRSGAGGGGGAARLQFAPAEKATALARALPRFAFDYVATPDGRLRIVPAADGFLTVTVTDGNTSRVLLTASQAKAASPIEIVLPADSTVATIVLTAVLTAQETVTATGTLGTISGALDPASGTKVDPNPSPASRLVAVVPLPPRR